MEKGGWLGGRWIQGGAFETSGGVWEWDDGVDCLDVDDYLGGMDSCLRRNDVGREGTLTPFIPLSPSRDSGQALRATKRALHDWSLGIRITLTLTLTLSHRGRGDWTPPRHLGEGCIRVPLKERGREEQRATWVRCTHAGL